MNKEGFLLHLENNKLIKEEIIKNIDNQFLKFQLPNGGKLDDFFGNYEIDPNKDFSSTKYLELNEDVKKEGIHPYFHYIAHGKAENRIATPSSNYRNYQLSEGYQLTDDANKATELDACQFWDANFYSHKYPDTYGWKHYIEYGHKENRIPNLGIIPEALSLIEIEKKQKETIPILTLLKNAQKFKGQLCSQNPSLSIVILNWNKSIMTLQCVYTLLFNTYNNDIEIIVVDNGSREHEFNKLLELEAYPFIRILRNRTNRFYGEANNLGVEIANSEYICLLNNDAFVCKDWDRYLLEELKNEDVGGVGPKFIFPDLRLQEAGGEINPCGQNVQIGKGLDPNLRAFNITRDVSHISAACFILRKDLFERLNGFDYRYEPAYYEDADLSAKITNEGFKIRYQPNAVVMHVENATSKDKDIGFDFGSLISTNRQKFVEKWSYCLTSKTKIEIPNNMATYLTGEELNKVAVVYSPYNLTPGGGERYILSVAIAIQKSGFKTYFCSPERYSKYRLFNIANELGLDITNINLIGEDEIDSIPDISLFMAMGNELSPRITPKSEHNNIYHCQFPFKMSPEHMANFRRNVENYQKVIVNSEFTKNIYLAEARKLFVNPPEVIVINPPVPLIPKVKRNSGSNVVRILSVGRFIANGHCKKQYELVTEFKRLNEEVEKQGLKSKLTLIGSLSASQEDREYLARIREIAPKNVEIILNATLEELHKQYQKADFYWHGTGIGEDIIENPEKFEHFGITPLEAIGAGCTPIVWANGGPREVIEAICQQEPERFIAFEVSDYTTKTLKLINEPKINFAIDRYSEKNFIKSVITQIVEAK